MAGRLLHAKSLPELSMAYHLINPWEFIAMEFQSQCLPFIPKNGNVCKMATIFVIPVMYIINSLRSSAAYMRQ